MLATGWTVVAHFFLSLVLALGILAAVGASASGGQEKVDICHRAGDKFVEISVAMPAVPAHIAHGDVMPDDYGECPTG